MHVMNGQLVLIGTPLGNASDFSPRALDTLQHLDALYCEDTRVTGKLLQHLGVKLSLRALSDDHGSPRVQEAVQAVISGKRIGYASDAGMPGLSDPGRRLVEAAWRAGVVPTVVPGPSAVGTLLAVCPFVKNSFRFAAFTPRKQQERAQFISSLQDADEPVFFFESPHRVKDLLSEMCMALESTRRVLIGREMTKLHEQFVLFQAGQWDLVRDQVPELGEFTIAVEARQQQKVPLSAQEVQGALERLEVAGFTTRDASKALAAMLDLKPNEIKRISFSGKIQEDEEA